MVCVISQRFTAYDFVLHRTNKKVILQQSLLKTQSGIRKKGYLNEPFVQLIDKELITVHWAIVFILVYICECIQK